MANLKLVAGLGNPGSKYEGTRHNVGFELIDQLAQSSSDPDVRFTSKFDGLFAEARLDFQRVLLLKPQTFMNLSGKSVRQVVQFYKLPLTEILVVCDDLSLPLGRIRLRRGGSDGGQKGLRDITAQLGTDGYPRLRIGIGDNGPIDAVNYVLGRFKSAERPLIDDALILASQAVSTWVSQDLDTAMNRFNGATPENGA